ncbi:MAG: ABC transporter permease [Maioricimonas sp. JB049]
MIVSPFRIYHTVRLALKSVLLHKLRSGLTMLGIVFGVFSVIAMLAIGEGASIQAQKQVLELGATNIIVRSVKPPLDMGATETGGRRSVLRYGLTRRDEAILRRTLDHIGFVPIREIVLSARYVDRNMNARVVGCSPEYLDMNHLQMSLGNFISDEDGQHMRNVAVLASKVATTLFPTENPLGKIVKLGGRAYRVIGVTHPRTASAGIGGSLAAQDYNEDIYIPLETMQNRINTADLYVTFTSGSFSAESVVYDQITIRVEDRDDVLRTAEVIRETMETTHPDGKDYAVVVPLELLKQADQLKGIFNMVLGSIAGISLIVGGIGIMNIMLATVTERTREIGIRRALGARQNDITLQFLAETIVLAATGGLIGVGMGLATPYAFRGVKRLVESYVLTGDAAPSEFVVLFTNMEPQVALWSLPVAFGFSVVTGMIFGVYPARSAARLDPIEALRHV